MLSRIFLSVPRTALCIVALTAFTASICHMAFQAETKLWPIGGIVTTISLLASGWVLCSLLIRQVIKKGWGIQRVSLLKIASFLVLILMSFTLTSQLVLADEDDDAHNRKAAVAAGVAVVAGGVAGIAAVASAPAVVVVGTVIMVGAGVYSAYHWYQSAADCECTNCSSPCSCSYPQCSNNDDNDDSGSCSYNPLPPAYGEPGTSGSSTYGSYEYDSTGQRLMH